MRKTLEKWEGQWYLLEEMMDNLMTVKKINRVNLTQYIKTIMSIYRHMNWSTVHLYREYFDRSARIGRAQQIVNITGTLLTLAHINLTLENNQLNFLMPMTSQIDTVCQFRHRFRLKFKNLIRLIRIPSFTYGMPNDGFVFFIQIKPCLKHVNNKWRLSFY